MQLHQNGRQPSVRPPRFKFMQPLAERRRMRLARKLEEVTQEISVYDNKRVQLANLTKWAEDRLYSRPVATEYPQYSGLKSEVSRAIRYLYPRNAILTSLAVTLVGLPLINDSTMSRLEGLLGIIFLSVTVSVLSVYESVNNCSSGLTNHIQSQIIEARSRLSKQKQNLMRKLGHEDEAQEKT